MANIVGLNIGEVYGSHVTQIGTYTFSTYDSTNTYIHLKTNIKNTYGMYMIEFVGYNYGASTNIRSAICFHNYPSTLYRVGTESIAPGLTPQTVYFSTDNFIVIRCYSSIMYFMGFTVNAYKTGPYEDNPPFSISAVAINTNSGTGSF